MALPEDSSDIKKYLIIIALKQSFTIWVLTRMNILAACSHTPFDVFCTNLKQFTAFQVCNSNNTQALTLMYPIKTLDSFHNDKYIMWAGSCDIIKYLSTNFTIQVPKS